MKKKKFIAVLATVGMVAAMAAGCGSSDDTQIHRRTTKQKQKIHLAGMWK